jgi:chromosome segregation ATPase
MCVDLSIAPPLPIFDFSVPPPNWPQPVGDQIASFLRDRNKQQQPLRRPRRRHYVPKVSFSGMKSDFFESQELLEQLKSVHQQLEVAPGTSNWSQLVAEAENIKTKLQTIESKYSSPHFAHELQKLYERRIKKRQRIKRRNDVFRTQRAESLKTSKARIEQWQREIATKQEKEHTANAEAAHAKAVLADVTRKIGDAKKYLAEFQALVELRKARKLAVQASDLGERDFEARIRELEQSWHDALVKYRQEEADLRRVLEARSSNAGKFIEKRWNQALFGDQATTLHNHPMLKANKDFDELMAVRGAWDTCLVDSNDANGTHIPSGWVMPNTDPLPEWKIYRKETTQFLD